MSAVITETHRPVVAKVSRDVAERIARTLSLARQYAAAPRSRPADWEMGYCARMLDECIAFDAMGRADVEAIDAARLAVQQILEPKS